MGSTSYNNVSSEMDVEAHKIVQLCEMLGLQNVSDGEDWVRCSCPFAPSHPAHWKDGRPGEDRHPSFGISVGQQSFYNCFCCQAKGPLSTLITSLSFMRGVDLVDARRFVAGNESIAVKTYEKPPTTVLKLPRLEPGAFSRYMGITTKHAYLAMRGVGSAAIDRFRLRYDPAERRVIFPVYDKDNRLVGVRGRSVSPTASIKMREYAELSSSKVSLKKAGIWYGMQFPLQHSESRVCVVEGEMDAISLWQATRRDGILASMGTSISDAQIRYLQVLPNPILLFLDGDPSGQLATEKLIRKLWKVRGAPLYRVSDYAGLKDPDEIVRAGRLKEVIKSAVLV